MLHKEFLGPSNQAYNVKEQVKLRLLVPEDLLLDVKPPKAVSVPLLGVASTRTAKIAVHSRIYFAVAPVHLNPNDPICRLLIDLERTSTTDAVHGVLAGSFLRTSSISSLSIGSQCHVPHHKPAKK